jgi:hypothetical protein
MEKEVTTTMDDDELTTANMTEQKQTMTTTATATLSMNRRQSHCSSFPQNGDNKIIAADSSSIEGVKPSSLTSTLVSMSSELDGVIDSITQGMSRKALNTRLKMLYHISPSDFSRCDQQPLSCPLHSLFLLI